MKNDLKMIGEAYSKLLQKEHMYNEGMHYSEREMERGDYEYTERKDRQEEERQAERDRKAKEQPASEDAEDAEDMTGDKMHQERFYEFWEKLFDGMSDEVLESTIYMIKQYDELNALAKQELGYRSSTEAMRI